ncbi:MAG: hypothetical protein ACYDCL_14130 [Myxococcales bacterium]
MKTTLLQASIGLSLALAATACSPSTAGGCAETCPVGCDISADCQTCVAESPQSGLGTACNTDQDCCNGNCINGLCTASDLGLGSSNGSGTGGGSNGVSSGSSTGTRSTSGGSSSSSRGRGSTGGNGGSCPPSPTPSTQSDLDCGDGGQWVCSPSGTCIPNCNGQPEICTAGQVCQINGHCETPGGSAGNGSAGSGSAGNGSAGSAGSSAGRSSSGSSSSGGNGSSGTSTSAGTSAGGSSSGTSAGGSSSGTSAGGSSSSGGSSGGSSSGGGGCGGAGQEYASCTSTADCACPFNCVADGSGSSYCLQPCASYQSCQVYETCDSSLSPTSCYPDACGSPWGACAAGNDTGSSQTGTCNVFTDSSSNAYGVCFAGGTAATGAACNFNPTYSTAASQQCTVGDFCGSTAAGDSCYQACDPTGTLSGAPACSGGTTCNANPCDCATDPGCFCSGSSPYCDPSTDSSCNLYFGVCQ